VYNLHELKQFVWCNHAVLVIQSHTPEYTHANLITTKAVHLIMEQSKLKILCHTCFVAAQQLRFV